MHTIRFFVIICICLFFFIRTQESEFLPYFDTFTCLNFLPVPIITTFVFIFRCFVSFSFVFFSLLINGALKPRLSFHIRLWISFLITFIIVGSFHLYLTFLEVLISIVIYCYSIDCINHYIII